MGGANSEKGRCRSETQDDIAMNRNKPESAQLRPSELRDDLMKGEQGSNRLVNTQMESALKEIVFQAASSNTGNILDKINGRKSNVS